MSNDIANLSLEINSNGVAKATSRLFNLYKESFKAEHATKRLGAAFKKIAKSSIVPLTAGFTAYVYALHKIIDATDKQQRAVLKLDNALRQTNGSVGITSKELQKFAEGLQKTTRLADEDVIGLENQLLVFTHITGEQFKRTTKVIIDFAEVTGRSASDAVRTLAVAVNDPINGMSRLRQAGIALDTQQQAQIKTLAKSGDVIGAQNLLLNALEGAYKGAAVAATQTLGGALDQLKNAFGDLLEQKGGVPEATKSLQQFTAQLQDPATIKAANALSTALISGIGGAIKYSMLSLAYGQKGFAVFAKFMNSLASTLAYDAYAIQKFFHFDTSAMVGQLTTVQTNMETWQSVIDDTSKHIKRLKVDFSGLGDVVVTATKRLTPISFDNPHADIGQTKAAEKLKEQKQREVDSEKTKNLNLQKVRKKAFSDLKESLLSEEEVIQASYDRRRAIIENNTVAGSDQQNNLQARLDKQFATQALGEFAATNTTDDEESRLKASYEKKLDLIRNNYGMQSDLEAQLTKQKNERISALDAEKNKKMLSDTSATFDGLADIAKLSFGKQAASYKALFVLSKVFSIASASLSIATASSKALELGFPADIGQLASVAAQGASILATIQSTSFSGAYDRGGVIKRGQIGLVGEYGPELITGAANVTGRKETANLFRQNASSANKDVATAQPQINVKNINVLDPSVVGDYLGTDEGEELIMNVVQRNQNSLGYS